MPWGLSVCFGSHFFKPQALKWWRGSVVDWIFLPGRGMVIVSALLSEAMYANSETVTDVKQTFAS